MAQDTTSITWSIKFAVVLLGILSVSVVVIGVFQLLIQPFWVESSAMEPTFSAGELVLILPSAKTELSRGDVIAYRPENTRHKKLGRIIGLPGDQLRIEAGRVYINQEKFTEDYTLLDEQTNAGEYLPESQIVQLPYDAYMILADNRQQGEDTRHHGFVTQDRVVGQVSECILGCR